MSYDDHESSRFAGKPFELYWFATEDSAFFLTSGDVPREWLGNTYTPESIHRSETDQNDEAGAGQVKVQLPQSHALAQLFVGSIPSTPMSVVIYRGHDGDSEIVTHWVGTVAKATFGEECELTCDAEHAQLKQRIPRQKFQPQCNRFLYDEDCGVDRTLYAVTGTVLSVSETEVHASAFASKPDGWFNNGILQKGTARVMILEHVGNRVTLIYPLVGLAANDSITAYAGCNRSEADCGSKFNNLVNFFGFARVPQRNPFSGI